jgi:hypothetical protein
MVSGHDQPPPVTFPIPPERQLRLVHAKLVMGYTLAEIAEQAGWTDLGAKSAQQKVNAWRCVLHGKITESLLLLRRRQRQRHSKRR